MPKVLSEELREAAAIVLLEYAKSKFPEYSDAQLSSAFKRASAKIRKIRTKPSISEAVQTSA